jgi:hypothetical protein
MHAILEFFPTRTVAGHAVACKRVSDEALSLIMVVSAAGVPFAGSQLPETAAAAHQVHCASPLIICA